MHAGINLLPGQKELCLKNKRLFYIVVLFNSALLLGILLLWYLPLWQTLNIINKKNINIKNNLYKLEQKISQPRYKQNTTSENNFSHRIDMITHNKNVFASIFNKINKNILIKMQLTQLNINTNQGKLFGTTEEITDITKILQDFMQSQYCIDPVVEKITRQNYRYNFVLSWRCKP